MANTQKQKSLLIGITETGDPGLDLSWVQNLTGCDGAILITKSITENFTNEVLRLHKEKFPIVLHATCTGMGSTMWEPNVKEPSEQIAAIKNLIDKGFPLQNIVLRIDPIIPTNIGINRFKNVLSLTEQAGIPITKIRKRISLLDQYPHVKERLINAGYEPLYNGYFHAAPWTIKEMAKIFDDITKDWPSDAELFHSCAEPKLAELSKSVTASGCVSQKDIEIMGLDISRMPSEVNAQNRTGCLCVACKKTTPPLHRALPKSMLILLLEKLTFTFKAAPPNLLGGVKRFKSKKGTKL